LIMDKSGISHKYGIKSFGEMKNRFYKRLLIIGLIL
jgi:hypothetical protein